MSAIFLFTFSFTFLCHMLAQESSTLFVVEMTLPYYPSTVTAEIECTENNGLLWTAWRQ